jgi:hypothetical protein
MLLRAENGRNSEVNLYQINAPNVNLEYLALLFCIL